MHPPTPWRTQMWVQVKGSGKRRSRGTLPSSQHLRGRGACWSSGMGLGQVDKLHSLTRACTRPSQSGKCIVGAPLVLGRATGNLELTWLITTRTWGSHHLPPYSILCASPRGQHPNGFSLPGLPRGSPEIPPARTLGTLRAHNFLCRASIAMRSEAKL
jgi:hypothetical protein